MTELIQTHPDPCTVTVTIPEYHVQCPYDDHTDAYTITITWTSRDRSVEYKSLHDTVMSYEGTEIGHEELATKLKGDIEYSVRIKITGDHYGMSVSVEA